MISWYKLWREEFIAALEYAVPPFQIVILIVMDHQKVYSRNLSGYTNTEQSVDSSLVELIVDETSDLVDDEEPWLSTWWLFVGWRNVYF